MKPGQSLFVVNDHEPVHLLHLLMQERRDFDADSYLACQKGPTEWVGVFKKKAASESGQNNGVIITSFRKERKYSNKAFSPVPIYMANNYRVILTYFRAGQFIPVHSPNIDLVFLVQSGTGEIVAGSKRQQIRSGDIIIVPRGQKRGIRANTDMEALHLVSPPPNGSDHEAVVKKLSSGRFE